MLGGLPCGNARSSTQTPVEAPLSTRTEVLRCRAADGRPGRPDDTARDLGIANPHPLIASLWDTVQTSCEARFYSEADWARLRLELWFADKAMAAPLLSARAWDVVQHGLNELLLSPAVKRRIGIEVRPTGPDVDADVAVSMLGRYRQNLKSV